MLKTNYAWNVQALVSWLDAERFNHLDAEHLAQALQIQPRTLLQWVTGSTAEMNPDYVQSIAAYRGWSLGQTARWLGLDEVYGLVSSAETGYSSYGHRQIG